MVLVGYARDDKEELFGELSDREIDKIINDISLDILKNKNNDNSFKYGQNKHLDSNKSKLIIFLSDQDITKSNGTIVESINLAEISPNSRDEEQVAKILDYWISIEMKSGIILKSAYSTIVQGVVNIGANTAHIENLITTHVYGWYFPGKNYGLGTNNAWIIFANAEIGFISFCRADFKISNTGKISLAGTVSY